VKGGQPTTGCNGAATQAEAHRSGEMAGCIPGRHAVKRRLQEEQRNMGRRIDWHYHRKG